MSDVAKTPREELECKKKYLYKYSMFWECNDGSKCQILEDDVADLLNEQDEEIKELKKENEQLKSDIMLIEKNADRHYEENKQLKKELNEYRQVIIDKVQYYEDNLEDFLIKKGVIKEDWARFDDYD